MSPSSLRCPRVSRPGDARMPRALAMPDDTSPRLAEVAAPIKSYPQAIALSPHPCYAIRSCNEGERSSQTSQNTFFAVGETGGLLQAGRRPEDSVEVEEIAQDGLETTTTVRRLRDLWESGEFSGRPRWRSNGGLGPIHYGTNSESRQKARANWFKSGDTNSKFFHSVIRWRRLKNEVKGVEVDNQWCEEPEVVRREAKKLFERRFTATHDFGVSLGCVEFKSLPMEVSLRLVASFTEEEVKEAVWQCEGSKSPGPDGYNFNFIKKCWETFKSDILEAVHLFQETGRFPKGCNASFIALVPKTRDPTSLDQFRPISLVGALYKIVTKVLSRRIKDVLPMVVDESQSAFLKDRGLLDSVLVANEVVEEVRKKRKSGLCLKVDYEKAYDSVRWNFLYDMLNRLGFHSKWIMWVRGCLETSSVSVLVNGSPTEEFRPSRGLRQGDPLAPFLFLMVAEGLAGLVRQALKKKLLTGLKVGRNEIECSVLQFADDTLLMCEDSYSNVITIKAILRCYELASGLKINFNKSKLAGIYVDRTSLDIYAKTLNCNTMGIPFKYLGLELRYRYVKELSVYNEDFSGLGTKITGLYRGSDGRMFANPWRKVG
ncbi:hypothetical protein VNO80_26632 [Phaseolus coccineus]|uniref:Reverse transcriptase domain-containing protein n=1 Tax=Phaseolus coccineus TaxID=3886 RepID=A0AAN9QHA8_PHACN